jgi:hypothetical protein
MKAKAEKPASEDLTLRDKFAIALFPALASGHQRNNSPDHVLANAVAGAYHVADFMMEARADYRKFAAAYPLKLKEEGKPDG